MKDRPARRTNTLCGFCGRVALAPSNYIFALTSVSLRDLPLLKDMFGGFLNIVFSKG